MSRPSQMEIYYVITFVRSCVHHTFVWCVHVQNFSRLTRFVCVHVQTFVRSPELCFDLQNFSRFLFLHQTPVCSCSIFRVSMFTHSGVHRNLARSPDFHAITRLLCLHQKSSVHVQTLMRPPPDFPSFIRFSCNHIQIFVFSRDFRAFFTDFRAFTRFLRAYQTSVH